MTNSRIKKLYLDVDDVLCDCTGDVMRHMGLFDWKREDHLVLEDRNIYEMYRLKTGILYEPHVFWEHFKREFWAGITPTPWCYDLIDLVCQYVPTDRVYLLTSPTKCGDCLAGKLDWIEEHLPKWMHRQYNMSPRKEGCAAPGHVLIDDATENTSEFGNDEHRGWPITFPQPWNQCRQQMGMELQYVQGWLDFYQREGTL